MDDDQLSIPYSDIDIRGVLNRGHDALDARHAIKEARQREWLRAGSAGCIIDGEIFGECHRIAHLRQIGIDKKHSQSRKLMFQAGEGNEDLWANVTVEGWAGETVRHLEIFKQGSWGTIMGHPDIILADTQGVHRVLLELKLISANFSAVRKAFDFQPDTKNLIQTATYAWMTGLPAVLCYTNRTDFSLQFDKKRCGGLDKIEPCYVLFYLKFENGKLYYNHEGGPSYETGITIKGIKEYYQMVHDIAFDYQLRARPAFDGFDKCDKKYCHLSRVCERWDRSYVEWKNEARGACETDSPN